MSIPSLSLETSYPSVVGGILIKQRELLGKDQGKVAQAMELSQSTWSRIERGESALSMDQLAKAAKVLETTPSDIISKADAVSSALKEQKIRVNANRIQKSNSDAVTLLSIGALLLLIAAVLSKK